MIRRIAPFFAGFIGMLAFGWFVFPELLYRSAEQPIQFSHVKHSVDGAGLSCEDCHVFAADGRFEGLPQTSKCAECHSSPLGEGENEKRLVDDYIRTDLPIPWHVYARQPDNVYFSHIAHVRAASIECSRCHGQHGTTDSLRPYYENRVSGYSRDIWGQHISGLGRQGENGMKMDQCSSCHDERNVGESCLKCHK